MQDVTKVRSFFAKLAAVTNTQEETASLKLLHGNRANVRFSTLQEVLVVGRKEEEQAVRRFDNIRDFGVGLPPLASSY
jgi:hypothetical protein